MPVLLVENDDTVRSYELNESKPLFAGSDESCDIFLPSPLVSKRHAVFAHNRGLSGIKDLGSTNGTFLNGQPLTKPSQIADGAVIRIASYVITYHHKSPPPPPPARAGEREDAQEQPERQESADDRDELPERRSPSETSVTTLMVNLERADDEDAETQAGHSFEPGTVTIDAVPGTMPPIPYDDRIRKAVEARLAMYPKLEQVAEERRAYVEANPNLPVKVQGELSRQEQEFRAIPQPDQVDKLVNERRAPHAGGEEKGEDEDRRKSGDPELSVEMFGAEKLAFAQWGVLQEYAQRLPEIFRLCYRIMAPEPLARELDRARVKHSVLFGGAAYYLVLEDMQNRAKEEAENLAARIREVGEGVTKDDGPPAKGFLSKLARSLKLPTVDKEELARLTESEQRQNILVGWLGREMAFAERLVSGEFWNVYTEAAVRFFQPGSELPPSARAFFRYGVIGSKPWWLPEAARDYIVRDCEGDIVPGPNMDIKATNVLFVDEYLTAIAARLYPTTPEATTGKQEKSLTVAVKTDRLYRKMLNLGNYINLLYGLIDDVQGRISDAYRVMDEYDAKLDAAKSRYRPPTREEAEMALARQFQEERAVYLAGVSDQIEKRLIPETAANLSELESQFSRRELVDDPVEEKIRRECRMIMTTSKLMSGARERFLPLAIRESFVPSGDQINDRKTILAEIAEIESCDPNLFLATVIPAKRRQNRADIRLCPATIVIPAAGVSTHAIYPREAEEPGRLGVPTFFVRRNARRKQMIHLLADYRWYTSIMLSGRDLASSNTLAGLLTRMRWEWRDYSKSKRERGLIFIDQKDEANWRLVYELYVQDAMQGAKKLFTHNPGLYNGMIGKFIDLPEGVPPPNAPANG